MSTQQIDIHISTYREDEPLSWLLVSLSRTRLEHGEKTSFCVTFDHCLMRPSSSLSLLFTILPLLVNSGNQTSFNGRINSFVHTVASTFHQNWRQRFLLANPHAKNRFKLTSRWNDTSSTDFIYPMILTVGSCLVHRNLRVARQRLNSSIFYVDVLNMNYDELPDDWAEENRATARVACRELLRSVRLRRPFDRDLIERISKKIHEAWIKRNAHRSTQTLLLSYDQLSELEKDKDRRAILIACHLFNQLHFYRIFRTNPIRADESFPLIDIQLNTSTRLAQETRAYRLL